MVIGDRGILKVCKTEDKSVRGEEFKRTKKNNLSKRTVTPKAGLSTAADLIEYRERLKHANTEKKRQICVEHSGVVDAKFNEFGLTSSSVWPSQHIFASQNRVIYSIVYA